MRNKPVSLVPDLIYQFIEDMKDPRKSYLKDMFTTIWGRFSTTPASTKYHGAYKEGLLEHTIAVTQLALNILDNLSETGHAKNLPSRDSLVLCCLVHDIGKIGSSDQPQYLPNNGKDSEYKPFIYNDNAPKMQHELMTLWWLNKFDIPLSESEIRAIMHHAGPYNPAHTYIAEDPLQVILHSADNIAAKVYEI